VPGNKASRFRGQELESVYHLNSLAIIHIACLFTSTNTAAPLGIADLRTLINEAFPCRAKWCNLGIQLRVDMGTLDCLRVQFSDPGDQLREVLRAWVTTSDSPTWGTLAEALRTPVIGENQLSREVQQKYCPDGHQAVQGEWTVYGTRIKMDTVVLQQTCCVRSSFHYHIIKRLC